MRERSMWGVSGWVGRGIGIGETVPVVMTVSNLYGVLRTSTQETPSLRLMSRSLPHINHISPPITILLTSVSISRPIWTHTPFRGFQWSSDRPPAPGLIFATLYAYSAPEELSASVQ